jgi:hypothetical protein
MTDKSKGVPKKGGARGRPPNAKQWGYRMLATIAHELAERHGVSIVTASKSVAEWGRNQKGAWAGCDEIDINEESIRQTVYALKKTSDWIHCGPGIIERASLYLDTAQKGALESIRAREADMQEIRSLAADRGLSFTQEELQIIEARNRRKEMVAKGKSTASAFSKPAKK